MSKKNAKNEAEPTNQMNFEIDDSGFVEEQIGFPPYWAPEVGKRFLGTVIQEDVSDPNFPRYIIQATHTMTCQRGPAEGAEKVIVQPGEFFTCSVYSGLPLRRFLGLEVLVEAKEKRKIEGAKTLWVFSLKVRPETKKMLEAERIALAEDARKALLAKRPKVETKQLAEVASS